MVGLRKESKGLYGINKAFVYSLGFEIEILVFTTILFLLKRRDISKMQIYYESVIYTFRMTYS